MSGPAGAGASPASVLDSLPGDLMMWILIVSELAVFGAGLVAFMGVRLTDVSGFALSQDHLNRTAGAINTIVLVSSGFAAAMATRSDGTRRGVTRIWLGVAMVLGAVFLWVKWLEYADKARQGIDIDTNGFFTFYYLLTGFHAMHVIAGLVIFCLLLWRPSPGNVTAGAMFWHMVDLIWVLLFPILYLVH